MSNSVVNKRFLEACQQRELLLQKCSGCGHVQFYPRVACTQCASNELQSLAAKGAAKVLSYTVIRQAISANFKEYLPYVAVLVELDEGPAMMSVVLADGGSGDANADRNAVIEAVEVGASVVLDFHPWGGEQLRPVFRLASGCERAT